MALKACKQQFIANPDNKKRCDFATLSMTELAVCPMIKCEW